LLDSSKEDIDLAGPRPLSFRAAFSRILFTLDQGQFDDPMTVPEIPPITPGRVRRYQIPVPRKSVKVFAGTQGAGEDLGQPTAAVKMVGVLVTIILALQNEKYLRHRLPAWVQEKKRGLIQVALLAIEQLLLACFAFLFPLG